MVRQPDGTYVCDDDGGGYPNPMVEQAFAAGDYDIFVGTFGSQTQNPPYNIGFSELTSVNAASVGAP